MKRVVRRPPLPTTSERLQVSGRTSTIVKKTTADAMERNQNIEGHGHLTRRSPLISGATLGGVLRLYEFCQVASSAGYGTMYTTYKTERKPT